MAARLGAKQIGTDLSEEAIQVARERRPARPQDRVEFRSGNLLDPVRGEQADVIIRDVSGIPDEIGRLAGWFPDGRAGGPTGAELPPAICSRSIPREPMPGSRRPPLPPDRNDPGRVKILEVARRIFGSANLQSLPVRGSRCRKWWPDQRRSRR